jgi:hypothetical protein
MLQKSYLGHVIYYAEEALSESADKLKSSYCKGDHVTLSYLGHVDYQAPEDLPGSGDQILLATRVC